jgi:hypothetical protein
MSISVYIFWSTVHTRNVYTVARTTGYGYKCIIFLRPSFDLRWPLPNCLWGRNFSTLKFCVPVLFLQYVFRYMTTCNLAEIYKRFRGPVTLISYPVDGSCKFLWNSNNCSQNYTAWHRSRENVVGIVTRLRVGWQGVRTQAGASYLFLFSKSFRPALSPNQRPIHCIPGLFPGQGMMLTIHLHPVPKIRMSRAIPLLHLYAFVHGWVDLYLLLQGITFHKNSLLMLTTQSTINNTYCFEVTGDGVFNQSLLAYTELFKMIVGVLTTCHTQYTWDSSV